MQYTIDCPETREDDRPSADSKRFTRVISYPDGLSGSKKIFRQSRNDASIKGTPVSGGMAEGISSVVRRPEDIRKVIPGSILVCPFLSHEYISPYLPIQGIICETGGMLSIAASFARKHNLPAVTGVKNIVDMVWDGDFLRIDGCTGYVYFIS